MSNKPTTDTFLSLLFEPDDLIEFRLIESYVLNNKKISSPPIRLWVKRKDWDTQYDEIKNRNDNGYNSFFGVCPRLEVGKAKKADIPLVRTLWIDVDYCDTKDFKSRLDGTELPEPSIVVHSGNGIHAYWLLAEAVELNSDADRQLIEGLNKSFKVALGGDHTHDVTRILRLPHPELFNVKNHRNGATPKPVTLIKADDVRYTIKELEAVCEPYKALTTTSKKKNNATQRDGVVSSLGSDAKSPLSSFNTDRSTKDFGTICHLIREGKTKDEAWTIVKNTSKFAERDCSYFEQTWKNAQSDVMSQQQDNSQASGTVKNPFITPDSIAEPKAFNTDGLPKFIKETIDYMADVHNVDKSIPATWLLATLSASTANLMSTISPFANKPCGTELLTIIVGKSASGKTYGGSPLVQSFSKCQEQADRDFKKTLLKLKVKKRNLEDEEKSVRTQLTKERTNPKHTKTSITHLEDKLVDIAQSIQDAEDDCRGGSCQYDDTTGAALLEDMKVTFDRAAFVGSESTGLKNLLAGSSELGSAEGILLKSFDRDFIKRKRKGSSNSPQAPHTLHSPAITMLATYTPELFEIELKKPVFSNSGLLQRCLVGYCKKRKPDYITEKKIKELTKWNALITELCNIPIPVDATTKNVSPVEVSVETKAIKWLRTNVQKYMETVYYSEVMEEDFKTWVERMPQMIVRIAGILHIVRHKSNYTKHKIILEDLQHAWNIYQYYASSACFILFSPARSFMDSNSNLNWLWKYAALNPEPFNKKTINNKHEWKRLASQTRAKGAEIVLAEALDSGILSYNTSNKQYEITAEARDYYHQMKGVK